MDKAFMFPRRKNARTFAVSDTAFMHSAADISMAVIPALQLFHANAAASRSMQPSIPLESIFFRSRPEPDEELRNVNCGA